MEGALQLLTLRQESYIKVVTGLTELASFQAASRAGAFEPEPEGRLMRALPAVGKLQVARIPTSAEGASGPATSSEAVSGRASPAQSEAGSAFGVG